MKKLRVETENETRVFLESLDFVIEMSLAEVCPLVFIDLAKKNRFAHYLTCLTPSCQAQQQGPHLDLLIRVGIQGGPGGSRCRCLLFRRRRRPVHQLCGSEPDQGLATNSILFSVSFM